jgi:hypothetical protein
MPATVAARSRLGHGPQTKRARPARSRPATRPAPARRTPTPAQRPSLATRARGLPDSGLVQRLAQGRLWIGILGALLAGIVALNVGSLSLSSGAGQALERSQRLDRQNSELSSKLARRLSAEQLEKAAGKIGMVVPDPGAVRYLTAARGDSRHAAKRLLAGLPAEPEPMPQPTPAVPVPAATAQPAAPTAAPVQPTAGAPAATTPQTAPTAQATPPAAPATAAPAAATTAAPAPAAAGGVTPTGPGG